MKFKTLIAVAAISLLAACTTLGNLTTPAANPLVQIAVDVAVAQAVGTGANAHANAVKISSIAK